ncbi:hypothetical protein [Spirosoma arcticum]
MKTHSEPFLPAVHQSEPNLTKERRYSLCESYKIPSELGKYCLLISLGLIVASALPGADFGDFKIPNVPGETKGYFLMVGVLLLGLYLLFHVAWFKYPAETNAQVSEDVQEVNTPIGLLTANGQVSKEGIQKFLHSVPDVRWFSNHFHDQYTFKDMLLTWTGKGPKGARGSLVFSMVENPLLKENITLLDYANQLYEVMNKTGVYRDPHVSIGSNKDIAIQWYIMTIPDHTGQLRDVHQLCKIVVLGDWLAYLFASYTDAASPEQKRILLETFEKFGT